MTPCRLVKSRTFRRIICLQGLSNPNAGFLSPSNKQQVPPKPQQLFTNLHGAIPWRTLGSFRIFHVCNNLYIFWQAETQKVEQILNILPKKVEDIPPQVWLSASLNVRLEKRQTCPHNLIVFTTGEQWRPLHSDTRCRTVTVLLTVRHTQEIALDTKQTFNL